MDDKKSNESQEINKKTEARSEVFELNDGSFAFVIPEGIVERLGWHEGEELQVSVQEGKISVSRTAGEAER